MFASKTFLALFAAAATVSARVVPRATPPAGWWTAGLEDYDTYHTRYLALGCQNQHGQAFFDECCHPLKKDETLETARPAQCIPSASASSSASLAEPTSTVTIPADVPVSSVTSSEVSSASASASAVANIATTDSSDDDDEDCDEDGDDDDDDEDCEDDGDDESSTSAAPSSTFSEAAPSSTAFSTSTEAASTTSEKVFAPITTSSSSTPAPSSTKASSTKASSTKASSTKTSSSEASTSTSSSSGQTITGGFATFFFQNGVAGACGTVHSDSDFIAAIDQDRYGNSGDKSDLCGKQVKITNTDNNKSVTVTIADDCPTCTNSNSIDLSQGAFDQIADEATGEVPISWEFV